MRIPTRAMFTGFLCAALLVAGNGCGDDSKADDGAAAMPSKETMSEKLAEAAKAAKDKSGDLAEGAKDMAAGAQGKVGDVVEQAKAKAADLFGPKKAEYMKGITEKIAGLDKMLADLKTRAADAGVLDKLKLQGMLEAAKSLRAGIGSQVSAVESSDESTFDAKSNTLNSSLDSLTKQVR